MREVLRARAIAFIQEFPFLKPYFGIERLDARPTVQRMDLDLLDKTGRTSAFSVHLGIGCVGSWELKFVLFGKDGTMLKEAKQTDYHCAGKVWLGGLIRAKWVTVPGESVLEAIQILPNPDDLGFILEREDKCPWDETAGLRVVLYKIPSGKTLSVWLAKLRQVAREELQSELAKIDGV